MMKAPTKSELVSKIERLEAQLVEKDRDREELRLRFVAVRERLEKAEIEDEDNSDKYQTVHPDNAHWMSSSDAYITIQTTGYDRDFDRMPKCRVCTIPVPDLTGGMRWNTKLPEGYRCEERDEDGRYTYKVSPHWEMVKEDEFGQHWHHPEMETEIQMLGEQDFTIEDRDQFSRRQKKECLERMNQLLKLAAQIQEFYNSVGDFPDSEVEVSAQFALRGDLI
jgi:hypothetical protein